jgi:hypothetical protein
MSAQGQKRKCPGSRGTSVLPSGPDIVSLPRHVRLVPKGDLANISTKVEISLDAPPLFQYSLKYEKD